MIEGAKNLSQLERLTKKLFLMLFGFQVVASIHKGEEQVSENFRTAPLLQVKLCQVGIIPGPAGQGLLFSWMNLISRLGWCDTGEQLAAGGAHR